MLHGEQAHEQYIDQDRRCPRTLGAAVDRLGHREVPHEPDQVQKGREEGRVSDHAVDEHQ